MPKKWYAALASLCLASVLFTGCGYYQTGDNQGKTLGNPANNQSSLVQGKGNGNTFSPQNPGRANWQEQTNGRGQAMQGKTMGQSNLDKDVTEEVRGWGSSDYYRYSRVNEPNSNIWGRQRGPVVPEWTPEGQLYRVKKAAPYMERGRERVQPLGSR